MAAACELPCALCGRALTEATRGRECGPPKSSGGRVKRKRGASIDDKDDEDDAPAVERLPADDDAAALPKKKKAKKKADTDEPDLPLSQDLTDRQVRMRHVRMVDLAIGDKKVAAKWSKTLLNQCGGLHGLCTTKRKDLLRLRCQGNTQIPTKLVDRLVHVFGPPQAAKKKESGRVKSTTPIKPTAAKPTATKPKPIGSSRKIPRLP
jgi:hypothetical protein